MASKRHKHACVCMIINSAFLENDSNLEDHEVGLLSQLQMHTSMCSALMTLIPQRRIRIPRALNYVEEIIPKYTEEDFRRRFRMSPGTFSSLLTIFLEFKEKTIIPMEKQLLIFIRYLTTQMTIQAIADQFGVCEYTVFDIVKRLANIVCRELLQQCIKWPDGEKVSNIVKGFKDLKNFPAVIGAIDGSHIPIKTPNHCPENYINRKSFPSVILQAVCDSKMHLLDVNCGWPGSVHDSRVFKNSELYQRIQKDPEGMFPNNTHLLGDSAYGLEMWMMTPYRDRGNLTQSQYQYNYIHSSTRMVIERTFGAIKGRFRRLKFVDIQDIEKIVKVVISCCVLHEFCLQHDDDCVEYIEEGGEDEVNNFVQILCVNNAAGEKRDSIARML
ncbi:putative nuclease HARBI1 [Saccostrea echinata]|uniref:putative nuclease HARBI1 n=2 Tax=Saccostrea echinata TaxID=191078 RepID=UPI002A80AF25|nr:putative nuclease HARBI1 [Saccostrea echinata]